MTDIISVDLFHSVYRSEDAIKVVAYQAFDVILGFRFGSVTSFDRNGTPSRRMTTTTATTIMCEHVVVLLIFMTRVRNGPRANRTRVAMKKKNVRERFARVDVRV
jgi:hypothetical protein